MANSLTLIYLMFLHYIADFILQSRDMGKNKSNSIKYLLGHLLIIFTIFLAGMAIFFDRETCLRFTLSNTVIHGIIDLFIWKYYVVSVKLRKLRSLFGPLGFQFWDDKWFYSFIGFDQFLHYATIILLSNLI